MNLPDLIPNPAEANTALVRSYATEYSSRATAWTDRSTNAQTALTALGTDPAAESVAAVATKILALKTRFVDAAAASTSVSTILSDHATALEGLATQESTARENAQSAYNLIIARRENALHDATEFVMGWAIPWDGTIASWLYTGDQYNITLWQAAIDAYRVARDEYNALGATRTSIDDDTARRLREIDLFQTLTNRGSIGVGGAGAAALLWAGEASDLTAEDFASLGDPATILTAWNGLTDEQRAALLAAAPMILGNLNGIPLGDRATANRTNIEQYLEDLRNEYYGQVTTQIGNISSGGTPSGDRLKELEAEIAHYESLLNETVTWVDENRVTHTETGARVIVFDPTSDAIATYHGPLDPETRDIPSWVRNVAVSVPGTTTTMQSFGHDTARSLQNAAGRDTAVIQWAGGRFPLDIPEATDASYSQDLAPKLAAFTNSLAIPAGAALTVLGHSYGGATVGLAEVEGMRADRVLYVSAAGMGAGVEGLDDFPETSDVPHYAMMARNDSVVGVIQGDHDQWWAIHGQTPLQADGVTRLETGFIDADDPDSDGLESYNKPGNWTPPAIDAHSTVFEPGSTAFNNIVNVITGGEVETFAGYDQIVLPRGGTIERPGYERDDYAPSYEDVP